MKKFILIVLFFIGSFCSAQQTANFTYTYDHAGNRIRRVYYDCCPRIASPQDSTKKDITKDYGINVFPNPTSETVNIVISELKEGEKATLFIYDVQGKEILAKQQSRRQEAIDLRNLAIGVYHLTVLIGENRISYRISKY